MLDVLTVRGRDIGVANRLRFNAAVYVCRLLSTIRVYRREKRGQLICRTVPGPLIKRSVEKMPQRRVDILRPEFTAYTTTSAPPVGEKDDSGLLSSMMTQQWLSFDPPAGGLIAY